MGMIVLREYNRNLYLLLFENINREKYNTQHKHREIFEIICYFIIKIKITTRCYKKCLFKCVKIRACSLQFTSILVIACFSSAGHVRSFCKKNEKIKAKRFLNRLRPNFTVPSLCFHVTFCPKVQKNTGRGWEKNMENKTRKLITQMDGNCFFFFFVK